MDQIEELKFVIVSFFVEMVTARLIKTHVPIEKFANNVQIEDNFFLIKSATHVKVQ